MHGIEEFEGSYTDGVLSCQFKRPLEVKITDKRVAANVGTFNLEKDEYVIFLAEGAFRNGKLRKHRIKDLTADVAVSRHMHYTFLLQGISIIFVICF